MGDARRDIAERVAQATVTATPGSRVTFDVTAMVRNVVKGRIHVIALRPARHHGRGQFLAGFVAAVLLRGLGSEWSDADDRPGQLFGHAASHHHYHRRRPVRRSRCSTGTSTTALGPMASTTLRASSHGSRTADRMSYPSTKSSVLPAGERRSTRPIRRAAEELDREDLVTTILRKETGTPRGRGT